MTLLLKLISAAISAATGPAPVTNDILTLDQAASIAERNAFSVRLQQSRVEQSSQRLAESRAGLGPTLSSGFSDTRYPQSQTAAIGTGTITTQQAETRTITGSISMPIDLFGNRTRQIQASSLNLKASRTTLDATRNDARLSAKSAYFNVLRAKASVGVAEVALQDAQKRLDQNRQLLAGEQVAKVDVTRLEAQLAQSQADLESATNTLQIQKNAFNVALARPVETPVELEDVTTLPELPSNVDGLVKTAMAGRPELNALRHSVRALALTRRAAEASLNPSLSFGVNYQRNLDAAGFSQKEQTSATLSFSVPIFDSGATRARVRQALQDEAQAKINLEQSELAVSQDVRNAITNMITAKARLASAESQVKAAQEVYRLAQVRQSAAEATYVEVIDALNSLVSSRNNAVSARYDYFVAYSQLQRAVGKDDLSSLALGTGTSSLLDESKR